MESFDLSSLVDSSLSVFEESSLVSFLSSDFSSEDSDFSESDSDSFLDFASSSGSCSISREESFSSEDS